MSLDCGGQCMKILLFIFNGLFFLAGGAMMGIGIWMMVDDDVSNYFTHIISTDSDVLFLAASIVMIVVGVLIIIITFFGCCGACRENMCMLYTFVIFVAVLLLLEITVVILAAVFQNDITAGLESTMSKQAQTDVYPYHENKNNTPTSFSWHEMQAEMHCCGGANYTDYKKNANFPDGTLPKSCCALVGDDGGDLYKPVDYEGCKYEFNQNIVDGTNLFKTGCAESLTDWVEKHAGILIGVACGVVFIQILGITFACCVRNQLKRKKEYV